LIVVVRTRTKLYAILSVVMAALIVIGFWPSYYGPLIRGVADVPWILHFHGVVYIGWMLLFIAQAMLGATGRIREHRKLGTFGIWYGTFIWILGVIVSFAAPVIRVNSGDWPVDQAAAFLPIPLGDMVLFGGFFAAAVIYRPKPDFHKRLMLLATVAVLFAAAFRMQAAGMIPLPAAVALWYVPVILGMIHDVRTQGRVHDVYWIGVFVMSILVLRLPFGETDFWLGIGRPIIEALR
jgi:hypothetical protein